MATIEELLIPDSDSEDEFDLVIAAAAEEIKEEEKDRVPFSVPVLTNKTCGTHPTSSLAPDINRSKFPLPSRQPFSCE